MSDGMFSDNVAHIKAMVEGQGIMGVKGNKYTFRGGNSV